MPMNPEQIAILEELGFIQTEDGEQICNLTSEAFENLSDGERALLIQAGLLSPTQTEEN